MNRRLFMCTLLAGAAGAAGAVAEAAGKSVRIAFVGSVSASTAPRAVSAFWAHMRELGWIEGENLVAETYWAEGRVDRLPGLMTTAG